MSPDDPRAKQLAADARRLAEIERVRLQRGRFASDSTWIAPRRIAAAAIEPPAEVPAHPDQFVAGLVSRYF